MANEKQDRRVTQKELAKKPEHNISLPTPDTLADKYEGKVISRRDFMAMAGWGSLLAFGGLCNFALLKFMFPKVTFEPPKAFKAGFPKDYPLGVSTKWKAKYRTWVIRVPSGFYAIYAKCTHLGCTPNWFAQEKRFKCPCHGSNFNLDGDVLAGPAPVPLYRCAISLASDGQIYIDTSIQENRKGQRETGMFFLTA